MHDTTTRLSAGETLAELMPDLHYGVLAELEECLSKLLDLLQSKVEEAMVGKIPIGRSDSPELTMFLPSTEK